MLPTIEPSYSSGPNTTRIGVRLLAVVALLAACSSPKDDGRASPGPACVEDAAAPPVYSVSQALALERTFIQAGRRDAVFDSVYGGVTPEVLAKSDELSSALVETMMADAGYALPVDDGSALGPGSCAMAKFPKTHTLSQAASKSSWFTFGVAYAILADGAKMAPFEGTTGDKPYTNEEDDTASDGTNVHYKTQASFVLTGHGSNVTATATLTTTITTANGSSTESASTVASIDVCPDAGGLSLGTFKLVADGTNSTGATYHVAADQTFRIVVGDDAETIGTDFAGSLSYTSTGPQANTLTLDGTVGYQPGSYNPSYTTGEWVASNGAVDNQKLVGDYWVTFAKVMADALEPEAKAKWRGGTCVEVKIDKPSSKVAPSAQVHVTATPHHKIQDADLDAPVVASLSGTQSLSPMDTAVDGPNAPFDYVAGSQKGSSGTVTFKSTSRRGIGSTTATYTVDCDSTVTCPGGAPVDPDTCQCACPGNGSCPEGSVWNEQTASCEVQGCVGGTIAGWPCVYAGVSSGTDPSGRAFSANVTLTATHFEGCALAYEPTGSVTMTPGPTDPCSYVPLTVQMNTTNTKGKMLIGLSPPTLIADFLTTWTTTASCGGAPIQLPVAGIWILTAGTPVVAGDPLVGTSSNAALTSSWNLTPQ